MTKFYPVLTQVLFFMDYKIVALLWFHPLPKLKKSMVQGSAMSLSKQAGSSLTIITSLQLQNLALDLSFYYPTALKG